VLARALADEYPWLEFLPEDARQQFTEEFFRYCEPAPPSTASPRSTR
jgi:hypothetical protein